MSGLVQIGDRLVTAAEMIPLLIGYELFPQFCRQLIIDQAIAAVECSEEERDRALQEYCEAHQLTNPGDRQQWHARTGITPPQLIALATRNLRITKFKQATWGHKLEAHFLTYKAQLDQVTYSLIRTADPEAAQELYFRIQAQEATFAELAPQYSQGPEAETAGLLGPVPLTQPHPAIAEKLARSKPGQLLPPTRIGDWYVILRLEKWLPAQLDDPTRQKLLDDLFDAWIDTQLAPLTAPPVSPAPPTLAAA